MGINVTKQASIPAGEHKGVIINAELKKTVFDPARGLEDTLEITIQPKWKTEDAETLPVRVSFSPVLNNLSALSGLLRRLKQEPQVGTEWEPTTLHGVEVRFTAEKNGAFVNVKKDTIRAA